MTQKEQKNLFGEVVVKDILLRDEFIEPPFSILDARQGLWQARKKIWLSKGIESDIGRDNDLTFAGIKGKDFLGNRMKLAGSGTSIFDPSLCEVLYRWFCEKGDAILDPFAGGSVRGIVANYLGYKYTGIDIRPEQIYSNREQAVKILPANNQPEYHIGDSNTILENLTEKYDFLFSCPPYADLEKYSNLEGDISNMKYSDFLPAYESIIKKSCICLKEDSMACFVVGEVRDSRGHYIGFVPDTIKAFEKAGMKFYNEAILLNPTGTAMLRAGGNMKSRKLVKIHQNILVFVKPAK